MRKTTSVIHCGTNAERPIRPLVPPIYQSTTFLFNSVKEAREAFSGEGKTDAYTRLSNKTHRRLEEQLIIMHNGEMAQVFASGMAAIDALFFSVLKTGSRVIAHKILYGCTYSLLKRYHEKFGVKVNFIDATKIEEIYETFLSSVSFYDDTVLFYLESLANPTLDCCDIKQISEWLHENFPKVLVVVDNTFATPYNLKPLEIGADIVIESLSKYLNGMGTVLGGAIITRKGESYWKDYSLKGGLLDPEVASQISNNLNTFNLRMEIHNRNAMEIAKFLEIHPKVDKVYYPGLASHPQHKTAKELMRPGYSGMVSFKLKNDKLTTRFLNTIAKLYEEGLSCIGLGVSLGAVYSLIESPGQMTHFGIPPEEQEKIGISEKIRFSVGIEDIEDIKMSLKNAFKCAFAQS
jgi:cystathionine beta-lyase/cystathionine gamma-synthase